MSNCSVCNSKTKVTILSCSHPYCGSCKRKEILPCLEGGNLTAEPKCDTCDRIFVDSDYISVLSADEYSKWRHRSIEKIFYLRNNSQNDNGSRVIKCSGCSKQNAIHQKFQAEEALFDEDRRSFLNSFKATVTINKLEEICSIQCSGCRNLICIGCEKSLGRYHNIDHCTILFSFLASVLLDALSTLFPEFNKQSNDTEKPTIIEEEEPSASEQDIAEAEAELLDITKVCLEYGSPFDLEKTLELLKEKYTLSKKNVNEMAIRFQIKKAGTGYDSSYDPYNTKLTGPSKDDVQRAVAEANKKEQEKTEKVISILTLLTRVLAHSGEHHSSLYPVLKLSTLIPILQNYLRNDWLTDVAEQQSQLYFLILNLFILLSKPGLIGIIALKRNASDSECLWDMIQKLNKQTDYFMKHSGSSLSNQNNSAATRLLGICLEIQNTYSTLSEKIKNWQKSEIRQLTLEEESNKKKSSSKDKDEALLLEEKYIEYLNNHAFEFSDPFPKSLQRIQYLYPEFTQNVSYPSNVTMRIVQELSSLSTTLPIYFNSAVLMRVDANRIHMIRFLVIAPTETPYSNGCFEFEMVIGNTYPLNPPRVQLLTTGHGSFRFNPNLYDNGKVCLSLLGTWSGPGWDPQTSTLLQILVSIQSLILIPDPYFNEPGYAHQQGTFQGTQASTAYNNNVKFHTIKLAMIDQIEHPTPGFEQAIRAHFYLKKDQIIEQCEAWTKENPTSNMKSITEKLYSLLKKLPAPN